MYGANVIIFEGILSFHFLEVLKVRWFKKLHLLIISLFRCWI